MDSQQLAEMQVINRIKDLLSENSVQYLAGENQDFDRFVQNVYMTADKQSDRLAG